MRCVGTTSCVVTQLTSGMIIGMLLASDRAGVTLIFGVLNVINFAHGSLYYERRQRGVDCPPAHRQLLRLRPWREAVAVGAGVLFERFDE